MKTRRNRKELTFLDGIHIECIVFDFARYLYLAFSIKDYPLS